MSAHKRFLTIPEFAAFSGYSEKTVRRRIAERRLPFYQPGGPGTKILLPFYQPGGPGTKILLPFDALDRAHEFAASVAVKDCGLDLTAHVSTANPARLPGPKPQWR